MPRARERDGHRLEGTATRRHFRLVMLEVRTLRAPHGRRSTAQLPQGYDQLTIQPVDRIRWPSEPFYTEDRFVNVEIHTRHRFIPAAPKKSGKCPLTGR